MKGYNWDYLDKNAYNNKVGHYKFNRQIKFIIENGEKVFDRVLDIAGGSGRFAIPLHKYSNSITVIDLNASALKLLEERDSDIVTINADFNEIVLSETFSFILCIEAIGYFENFEVFFNKVSSLLITNGRFVFTYTNPSSWRFFLRKLKHWKNGFHPYKEVEIDELKIVLKKCNLEIDRMEGMNWIPLPLHSNSKLVHFFEYVEKKIKLKNWHSQSPWLLMSVKKTEIS